LFHAKATKFYAKSAKQQGSILRLLCFSYFGLCQTPNSQPTTNNCQLPTKKQQIATSGYRHPRNAENREQPTPKPPKAFGLIGKTF